MTVVPQPTLHDLGAIEDERSFAHASIGGEETTAVTSAETVP